MNNPTAAVLDELGRLAVVKYGDRITVNRNVFTIDGIRLFVRTAERGSNVHLWIADDIPRVGPADNFPYESMLERLDVHLTSEKIARAVWETR